jgi:hypothetical protein
VNTHVEPRKALLVVRPARLDEPRLAEPAQAQRRSVSTALRGGWQRLWMDERGAYLSQATSHADLERRLQAWNDADRRRRMPLP